jgi:hypothetical protein
MSEPTSPAHVDHPAAPVSPAPPLVFGDAPATQPSPGLVVDGPPAAPGSDTLTLSRADVQAMIANAVEAGRASVPVPVSATPGVSADETAKWSLNDLMMWLVGQQHPHTEAEQRAAFAAVSTFYPADDDTDEAK